MTGSSFCKKVIMLPPPLLSQVRKMPPIPWDQLFELLFDLLEDCGDDAEQKVNAISNRPFAVFFAVTRSLRKLGYSGRNLRQARKEVYEEINDATEEELKAFAVGGYKAVIELQNA